MSIKRDWISSKVNIHSSLMGGKGMFANSDIEQDEKVVVFGGNYTDTNGAKEARKNGKLIMQWDDNLYSYEDRADSGGYFINHSCDSNMWMADAYTLVAKRNIKSGEELTADYVLWEADENFLSVWVCKCGSSLCRGRVTGKDWRNIDLQERYLEPVGSWGLDEPNGAAVAYDGSGNNNNGNISGAAIVSAEGMHGNALSFNGINNFITVPNNSSLGVSQMTIMAWIKENVSGLRNLIAEKHTSPTAGWWFAREFAGGIENKLLFIVNDIATNERYAYSNIDVPVGKFVHVAGTYDGTNIRVYIDGNDVTGIQAGVGSGNIGNSVNPMTIGRANWAGGHGYFNGIIDDVRIYDKALTSAEIQKHYAEGSGKHQMTKK